MSNIDLEEYRKAMQEEYKALNVMVGELLINESATPEQVDDLAYYNRKLAEARIEMRKLASSKVKKA